MLIKLLPESEKELLLDLTKLLTLSDNPLLWGGKPSDELTSNSDLTDISIQKDEQEDELIADFERSAGFSSFWSARKSERVERQLIEELKKLPISKIEQAESRLHAATTVLKKHLEGKSFNFPSTARIILFELILAALRDGNISNIEQALLKEVQLHCQLEDFIFDDLLERAEALNNEISKTISIVLE
ncbi:hypothetical protein [Methylomicrobium lacus]|uniref:hypothetical protein n=1 Tax=Methylomicrobium lacus TaxID=136992 RepID=UPI0035A8ED57